MSRPIRLAHISDLHFGRTEDAVVHGLVDHLNADEPDLVIVGGDLTQAARPEEFAQARAFLDRLGPQTLVVPGNHDLPGWAVWARFLNGYRRYRTFIDEDLDVCVETDGAIIVGLNSTRRFLWHWNWSNGAISRRQLAFARRHFEAAAPDARRVLVLHHPLVPPVERPAQKLVGNADSLAEGLSALRTDLVMTGHLHTMRTRLVTDHFEGLDWSFPVVQTATSTSTRLRGEANGLSLVHLEHAHMDVQSWQWDGTGFARGRSENFARNAERGWVQSAGASLD